MLRVTEKQDEIIIRELPVWKWSIAGIEALFLVFITTAWFISNEGRSFSFWIIPFLFFFGTSLYSLLQMNPATTIRINKPGKTISVRKRSLLKYSFDVYSFGDIAYFIYIDEAPHDRFRMVMPLKDGRKIELANFGISKNRKYTETADLMNPYIFDVPKHIPFRLSGFSDE